MAIDKGVDIIGITGIDAFKGLTDPKDYLPDAKSVITLSLRSFKEARDNDNISSWLQIEDVDVSILH